eukprot:31497-Pelagococcus_subviridis.AAC.49
MRISSSRNVTSRNASGPASPPPTVFIASSTGTVVPFRKLSAGMTLVSSCRTVVVSATTENRVPSSGSNLPFERDPERRLHDAVAHERPGGDVDRLHDAPDAAAEHPGLVRVRGVEEVRGRAHHLADAPEERRRAEQVRVAVDELPVAVHELARRRVGRRVRRDEGVHERGRGRLLRGRRVEAAAGRGGDRDEPLLRLRALRVRVLRDRGADRRGGGRVLGDGAGDDARGAVDASVGRARGGADARDGGAGERGGGHGAVRDDSRPRRGLERSRSWL